VSHWLMIILRRTNLGKILRKSYKVSKIGPQNDSRDVGRPPVAIVF